jgi:hypothetical protein
MGARNAFATTERHACRPHQQWLRAERSRAARCQLRRMACASANADVPPARAEHRQAKAPERSDARHSENRERETPRSAGGANGPSGSGEQNSKPGLGPTVAAVQRGRECAETAPERTPRYRAVGGRETRRRAVKRADAAAAGSGRQHPIEAECGRRDPAAREHAARIRGALRARLEQRERLRRRKAHSFAYSPQFARARARSRAWVRCALECAHARERVLGSACVCGRRRGGTVRSAPFGTERPSSRDDTHGAAHSASASIAGSMALTRERDTPAPTVHGCLRSHACPLCAWQPSATNSSPCACDSP